MILTPVEQFQHFSLLCSKAATACYSTSFYSAIRLLHPELHDPVYSIYGFVRVADEIVDSFHNHDKAGLLKKFRGEAITAIDEGISLNPVLNSFQHVVNTYNIDKSLIEAFFKSMEMDLEKSVYHNGKELDEYIYGSAEVVGLMCLYVFCDGNTKKYNELKEYAQALGAAFQKVNFLRDLRADYKQLNRTYFPGLDFYEFNCAAKKQIETDIENDFRKAYTGIMLLPVRARFGVYVAYKYYRSLFRKIKKLKPEDVMERRVRIPNYNKAALLVSAHIANQFNMIR